MSIFRKNLSFLSFVIIEVDTSDLTKLAVLSVAWDSLIQSLQSKEMSL